MKKSILFILLASAILIFSCTEKKEQNAQKEAYNSDVDELLSSEFLVKGNEIAAATQSVLGARLKKGLEEGGVEKAISLCNVIALPVVDSLSDEYDAVIRRTALKVRNIQDSPSKTEKRVLKEYYEIADKGEIVEPKVVVEENVVQYFSPIIMQPLCLKCHGDIDSDIGKENYSIITEYYPDDKAIDFKLGELRGMWSIAFER